MDLEINKDIIYAQVEKKFKLDIKLEILLNSIKQSSNKQLFNSNSFIHKFANFLYNIDEAANENITFQLTMDKKL